MIFFNVPILPFPWNVSNRLITLLLTWNVVFIVLDSWWIKNKINSYFSSKVLSWKSGSTTSTGILLRNVSSIVSLPSVVAKISRTFNSQFCPLSPILEIIPLSIYRNNFSCPSGDRRWTSSKNRYPLSASSIRPFVSLLAPVNAPFLYPNKTDDNNSLLFA